MPSPTANQVHIDSALTNISIAYRNENYIGDRIFPKVPVVHQSNKYFVFVKADWYRDEAAVRAPGTRAARVDYNIGTGNYLCTEWAAAKAVPDEVIMNADAPLKPLAEATEYVTQKLMLRKEKDVADLVFGTNIWSGSTTPAVLWSNDTSDPIGDVNAAQDSIIQSIGRKPNKGVIGRGAYRHLIKHPDILDRIRGGATSGTPAIVSMNLLAQLFELDEILVGDAVIDSGLEGQASSRGYVWGNSMWLGYVSPTPAIMTPSAGYIFQWKDRQVFRFREDQEFTDVVSCYENWDSKAVAADAGYLLRSVA